MNERESFLRYYQLERLRLECVVITPMFLGGADQEADWRAEPFKALLRNWWRVAQPHISDWHTLLNMEGGIFGRAGEEKVTQKSPVMVHLTPEPGAVSAKTSFPKLAKIDHSEVQHGGGKVDPLGYLAGMGLVHYKSGIQHSYFPPNAKFCLEIQYPAFLKEDMDRVLSLIEAFGSVGSRSRKGWGSFSIANSGVGQLRKVSFLNKITREWKTGLSKDYPNCLGKSGESPLIWKTGLFPGWAEAMGELARVHIAIRAAKVGKDGPINPGGKGPAERHLLGVPITNHMAWEKGERHASPLRFCVRELEEKYWGLILHVPHAFGQRPDRKFPPNVDSVKTWEMVHRKLDAMLERANYEECVS